MSAISSYKQRRSNNVLNTGNSALNSVLNFYTLKTKIENSIRVKSNTSTNTPKKKRPVYRFRGYGDKAFYL